MSQTEFRRLYDTVFPILFRIAFRISNSEDVAEDLCQDAFIRLFQKDIDFPNLDEAKFWLIRVVKNGAFNYLKHEDREKLAYQKAFREDDRAMETGETEVVNKQTKADVRDALKSLPESLRMVLILKEYAEMDYKHISDTLGISEGNVKTRVYRARERLADILRSKF